MNWNQRYSYGKPTFNGANPTQTRNRPFNPDF